MPRKKPKQTKREIYEAIRKCEERDTRIKVVNGRERGFKDYVVIEKSSNGFQWECMSFLPQHAVLMIKRMINKLSDGDLREIASSLSKLQVSRALGGKAGLRTGILQSDSLKARRS